MLVVLIHGLGRGAASMLPLAWRLRHAGFSVERLRYPSTRLTIAGAVEHVRAGLHRIAAGRRLDLVGHSLGGLIALRLLRDPCGLGIRRVVQLGSPNRGSVMADRLGALWLVRRLCGPAVEELCAHHRRTALDGRVAAIAGTGGLRRDRRAQPHDGTVTVRSAWSGAAHRAHVPVLHAFLPASARVARLVAAFLRDGRFPEGRA